jgi:hypothetical protein
MKKYIAVLEIEDNEEIVDAKISYIYSSNGMNYKATERMELKEENEDAKNKTYEDGLNEAWELARDIIAMPNSENKSLIRVRYNALGNDALYDIIRNYSASEIIKKIKEYEEIIVGDEVTNEEEWKGVVTWINPNGEYMEVMLEDGTTIQWKKTSFKKTGRHFSQIEEVLKQLKEDEDE